MKRDKTPVRNIPIRSPERFAALLHDKQVVERLMDEYGEDARLGDILPTIESQMKNT